MKRKTLVYYNGGETFKGSFELTKKEEESLKVKAKEDGQVSFVSGFIRESLWDEYNKTAKVIVFLSNDSQAEVGKRSKNGLLRASWYPLN